MTKHRLITMTAIDMVFILLFGYASLYTIYDKQFEAYFTIVYFFLAVSSLIIMLNRFVKYYHLSNTIKIKYFNDQIRELEYIDGKSDWIDLRVSETVELEKGEFALIPLGVAMKLLEGYEANIVPRSSTFENYGIIQTNSFGVIDNTYCGDGDMWKMPVYATRDVIIKQNERICQFRVNKNQKKIKFQTVKKLGSDNRGGFGSTGK